MAKQDDAAPRPAASNGYDPIKVKEFVDRAERLQEAADEIAEDKKALFEAAKDAGLPVKALRKLIAERKARAKDTVAYDNLRDQVDSLKHSLGDFGNTDLGRATIAKAEAAH